MPRFIKMWLFSALISFTALGMWKGMEWYYGRDVEDVPIIVMQAEDLALAYEASVTNASVTYNGNDILLTGVVTNMGGTSTNYTVNLDGSTFYDIDLNFSSFEEIALVKDVNIGDVITIIGVVQGTNALYISITNCSLE